MNYPPIRENQESRFSTLAAAGSELRLRLPVPQAASSNFGRIIWEYFVALELVDLLNAEAMHLADVVAYRGAGRNVEALGGLGWASISRRRRSIDIRYAYASNGRRKNGRCRFIPTSENN